jgi:hypothetical protein
MKFVTKVLMNVSHYLYFDCKKKYCYSAQAAEETNISIQDISIQMKHASFND